MPSVLAVTGPHFFSCPDISSGVSTVTVTQQASDRCMGTSKHQACPILNLCLLPMLSFVHHRLGFTQGPDQCPHKLLGKIGRGWCSHKKCMSQTEVHGIYQHKPSWKTQVMFVSSYYVYDEPQIVSKPKNIRINISGFIQLKLCTTLWTCTAKNTELQKMINKAKPRPILSYLLWKEVWLGISGAGQIESSISDQTTSCLVFLHVNQILTLSHCHFVAESNSAAISTASLKFSRTGSQPFSS